MRQILAAGRRRDEKLGTFIGVFTPSVLTILGVILYLRTGWVVGSVGLTGAIVIVVIANLVTLATAMSVSAVATNMHVGPGGAYYIISRSLGIEVGAAIGIPLFLAQAVSVTLYAFGLAESLGLVWPGAPQRVVAAVTVLVVALLAARGAGLALRLQIPIMVAIAVSLVVLGIGVARGASEAVHLTSAFGEPQDFWTVFAVFFPAVTGILAGISLSGDLKRPDRSIPRGTIAAVLVGFVIYLGAVIALALAADPTQLVSDHLIWFTIAGAAGFLIFPGLWGAIFSSAVGSVLSAPRTLEAMIADRILPRWLGTPIGTVRGPGVPLLIALLVALAAVLLGGIDAVAPVLTMFFLTTYGMVNLVAGIENLTADPSYRPTMRVHWAISLVGAAGCFWVMFLIDPAALVIAMVIEVGVYLAMRRRALIAPWGDLRRGAMMSLVRSTVIQLRRLPNDPRNWRPNILLFSGDVRRRPDLARFAAWLVQDRGILTVCELAVGSLDTYEGTTIERRDQLDTDLDALGIVAFAEVDVVDDFIEGAVAVAQANGIAGIESNTIMFGYSDKLDRRISALQIIERLARIGKSAIVCRTVDRRRRSRAREIHVWWGGLQNNGDMLALFAHLISLNPEWRDATIRIMSIASNDTMAARNAALLDQVIRTARIPAETMVLVRRVGQSVEGLIRERSAGADVVLMGLRANRPGEETEAAHRLAELVEGLPTVIFVRSAGEFRGRLLGDQPLPEVGLGWQQREGM
jgi:potassium/chloride transporter 4/5/6